MKRVFSKSFFHEVFRQLTVPGAVTGGVFVLFSILIAIIRITSAEFGIPSALELSITPIFYIYVAGFMLPIMAFGWLNKRSKSDFYHSIPLSRTQLYTSAVLAIFVWMCIGILAGTGVRALTALVMNEPFNYLMYGCVIVNMLIAALEIIGAVSLACAVTGTWFSNISAALVILFIPRLIFAAISVMNESGTLFLRSNQIFLVDPSYNLIAMPYGLASMKVSFTNAGAMLYTFAYSIVLLLLGKLAFKRRKSELAGNASSSWLVQTVIRTFVCFPILLIPILLIRGFEPLLFFGVLSFVIYCMYELISTKSAAKMLKAMPLFIVDIVLAGLVLIVPKTYDGINIRQPIDASNIASVRIKPISDGDYIKYADIKTYDIVITDYDVFELFEKASESKANDHAFYDYEIELSYKDGSKSVKQMELTLLESMQLESLLMRNKSFSEAQAGYPGGRNYYHCKGMSAEQTNMLARTLEKEFAELSVEKRETLLDGSWYTGEPSITLVGCVGVDNYHYNFSLDSSLPKTLEMYLGFINDNEGEKALKLIDSFEDWTKREDESVSYTLELKGEGEGSFVQISSWVLSSKMVKVTENPVAETPYEDEGESNYIDEQNRDWEYDEYNEYYSDTEYVYEAGIPAEVNPEYCEIISILSRASLSTDINNYLIVTIDASGIGVGELTRAYGANYTRATASVKLASDEDSARLNELIRKYEYDCK